MTILVIKFGGAAVSTPTHFSKIAEIIVKKASQHKHLVVVVSAMGDTTNHLINLASEVNPDPPQREYDMLLTAGERISMALLAMAIAKKGVKAVSFTGSQSGIITCDRHKDARIIDIKPHRINKHLEEGSIVIVAGFQGVSKNGEITTLGRGGSDTTAVALGCSLKASSVEFFKDVPGIFNEDPKINPKAVFNPQLSYEAALEIISKGAKVLHPRSLLLAKKNGMPLHICSFEDKGEKRGTIIHELTTLRSEKPLYEDLTN